VKGSAGHGVRKAYHESTLTSRGKKEVLCSLGPGVIWLTLGGGRKTHKVQGKEDRKEEQSKRDGRRPPL